MRWVICGVLLGLLVGLQVSLAQGVQELVGMVAVQRTDGDEILAVIPIYETGFLSVGCKELLRWD